MGDRIPLGFVSLHSAWESTVSRLKEMDPTPAPTRRRQPATQAGAAVSFETIRSGPLEEDEAGALLCLAFASGELAPQYWPGGWTAADGCGIEKAAWDEKDAVAIFDRVVWRGGWGNFPQSLVGYAPCVEEKALIQWLETRLPELRGKAQSFKPQPPRQVGDTAKLTPAMLEISKAAKELWPGPGSIPARRGERIRLLGKRLKERGHTVPSEDTFDRYFQRDPQFRK